MASKIADNMIKTYAEELARVMTNLEVEIIAFMRNSGTSSAESAATILNSRANFIQALQTSGYNDLSQEYVAQYSKIPGAVNKAFAARKLPPPQFSTVSVETFQGLASIDLNAFSAIGNKAMEDLRVGLYKQVIGGADFKGVVNTIKASTTGLAGNGSPLSNYAYTQANTAILGFNGEVTRVAGESIGFDSDDDEWEVIGPEDSRNRDECIEALADPVRPRGLWISADYWGGAPGGYNCRHELFPYIGEE